jgi:hypothetical protein
MSLQRSAIGMGGIRSSNGDRAVGADPGLNPHALQIKAWAPGTVVWGMDLK